MTAAAGCMKSGNLDPGATTTGSVTPLVCVPPASDDAKDLVCSRWACGHADLAAADWDGDAKQCTPGAMGERSRALTLRLINAYRYLAGVPDLDLDPRWEAPAQDCALLAHANRKLSHTPPKDWACWSDRGARASAVSLIANRSAPLAIDPFIEDPGNESTMVHRRWLLSEKIHRVGLGSTNGFACALVDGRQWDGDPLPAGTSAPDDSSDGGASDGVTTKWRATDALPTWVAWPPPGPVPFDVFRRTNVDRLGWTVQSSSLDLDGARVEIHSDGAPLAIKVSGLERTMGSLTALRILPDGWSTEPGKSYAVHVEKEGVLFDFTVEPINCP
jgi:Cysteine-rich secretory protein family